MLTMKVYSLSTIMLSISFALSSNSWLQLWMSLELNMLAFIPFMYANNSPSIVSMLKYFFIQAIASSMFLLSILLMEMYNFSILYPLLTIAMLTKLGMFPMFSWFPQIASSLSWMKNIVLMFPQKIIPLFSLCFLNSFLTLYFSTIMSSIISVMGMWSQKFLKKIMAYSSINHLSWMMLSLINKSFTWTMYLIVYSLVISSLFVLFNFMNVNSLYQINYTMSSSMSLLVMFNMWSLGGLPPLMGFFPKLLMILECSSTNMMSILLILILSSLISLYIYTTIMYPSLFKKSPNNSKLKFIHLLTMFNIVGLMPVTLLAI